MNRRRFLVAAAGFLGLPVALTRASGDDDEVGIPVEDCPCCCSNDDGLTWFSCDALGNPLDGDPANCSVHDVADGTPIAEPVAVDPDDEWWMTVDTLPNTGTGSTAPLPSYVSNRYVVRHAYDVGAVLELTNYRGDREIALVYESFPDHGLSLIRRAQAGTRMIAADITGLKHQLIGFVPTTDIESPLESIWLDGYENRLYSPPTQYAWTIWGTPE